MLSQNISMVYYLQGPHCAEYCILKARAMNSIYKLSLITTPCPQAEHAWVNKYIILHPAHTQNQSEPVIHVTYFVVSLNSKGDSKKRVKTLTV